MARRETKFMFGNYRGLLRHRSISEWSKTLEVSVNAINNHIERGGSFQEFIDSRHDATHWRLFSNWCYA